MDQSTFNRLEFSAVLEHVAAFAESGAARRELLDTRPWTDPGTIRRHWDAVEEILGLLDSGGDLPMAGFDDCGEMLAQLERPGAFLEPAQWLALKAFLGMGRDARRRIRSAAERFPVAWPTAETIDPLPDLTAEIGRVFDDDGQVRDGASKDLKACRSSIKRLERELERAIDGVLTRFRGSDTLQGEYWTLRGDRRVVPVRVGARGRLPGIVHDTSNTGETLFVEPMETIEPANRLAREENREREIIRRILEELTATARADAGILSGNREALVQLDLWRARARLAYRHNLHRPLVAPGLPVDLLQAHHPLLYFADPKRSVPLSMRLAPENRALVITGPNTGGKTTSLKTVGLIVLMAQSAIPVPAAVDSRLPVFEQALAEIGDDQSVAAGLSTFSAHIRRVSAILEVCAGHALVLLDELGKATDPLQAGALGRAILEALVERGALTLVTTHLGTLKDWAHDNPAGRNASFRLDGQTHRPLYQIHLDTPGISEAFTIARAEGLPGAIVDAAIEHLPKEEREIGELLDSLHRKEARLESELRQAKQAQFKADQERQGAKKLRTDLQREKIEQDRKLESDYKALLDKARGDLESRIANLPSRQALSQARKDLERDQKAAEQRLEALRQRERQILESAAPPSAKAEAPDNWQPKKGDWVTFGGGSQTGRIERLDATRAFINAGGIQIRAALKDLRPAQAPKPAQAAASSARYLSSGPAPAVSSELNLVGQRVEAAMAEADRHLDRAMLNRMSELRIVHGFGTGALREALHELLRAHPHVRSFRLADREGGGSAVTLVKLKG